MSLFDNFPHRCRIQRRKKSNDSLIGGVLVPVVEHTDVECWEQSVSSADARRFQKEFGIVATKVVFFQEDLGLTARHEVVITERDGVEVPEEQERVISSLLPLTPDASAGLGVLWRVIGTDILDATT